MSGKYPTRERILDAAEILFADRGFDASSLRMITATAGVNLAAVNYHFRSKDALIESVFARRLGPINQQRLRLLEDAEAAADGGPVSPEEIVRAFIAPVIEIRRGVARGGADIGQLVGRLYMDPSESVRNAFFTQMKDTLDPFLNAFRRALPWLPPVEFFWRLSFMAGILACTMAGVQQLKAISSGLCDPLDVDGTTERIISFVCAGMRAPLKAPNRS